VGVQRDRRSVSSSEARPVIDRPGPLGWEDDPESRERIPGHVHRFGGNPVNRETLSGYVRPRRNHFAHRPITTKTRVCAETRPYGGFLHKRLSGPATPR
jgi:hypothetical protein